MLASRLCWIHRGFMAFPWHFLPLQTCHPQVNHIHGSFMALSHGTFSQCHEHDSLEGDNFEVVESAMKAPSKLYEMFGTMISGLPSKCHESAMALSFNQTELQTVSCHFHG